MGEAGKGGPSGPPPFLAPPILGVLSHTGEATTPSPPSLFKIAQFLKIMRLVFAFTRMNGDRYKVCMDALRRQAVVYGLEVLFSFVAGTGRYFIHFMGTSHIGSCVWAFGRICEPTTSKCQTCWTWSFRMGVCWLIFLGSRTSRMPTATPSLTFFDLRRHTQV